MAFEGAFASVALVVSFICFFAVMACLRCSRKQRKNRLIIAGTHLIRAGEAFTDASVVLLRELQMDPPSYANIPRDRNTSNESSVSVTTDLKQKCDIISKSLSRVGTVLQKSGCALVQTVYLTKDEEIQINFELLRDEDMTILQRYTEVVDLLTVARASLRSARTELAATTGSR